MKIFIALLSIFCFSVALANDDESAADLNSPIIDEMSPFPSFDQTTLL